MRRCSDALPPAIVDVAVPGRGVAELAAQLVAVDSVNPALVPGGAGEAEIARVIAGWARAEGLEVDVLEATAGRPSVLVRARGSGGPGGEGAHAIEEWVSIADTQTVARTLVATAQRLCA